MAVSLMMKKLQVEAVENLTGDYFVTHVFCKLCVFFHDGKFLLEAGGILSLCKFS